MRVSRLLPPLLPSVTGSGCRCCDSSSSCTDWTSQQRGVWGVQGVRGVQVKKRRRRRERRRRRRVWTARVLFVWTTLPPSRPRTGPLIALLCTCSPHRAGKGMKGCREIEEMEGSGEGRRQEGSGEGGRENI